MDRSLGIIKKSAEEWKAACEKEIDAFNRFQVWEGTTLPEERKAIPCQWVFKLKIDDVFKERIACFKHLELIFTEPLLQQQE